MIGQTNGTISVDIEVITAINLSTPLKKSFFFLSLHKYSEIKLGTTH